MRKIECKTEGCTSYYDGEFPENDWACLTCARIDAEAGARDNAKRVTSTRRQDRLLPDKLSPRQQLGSWWNRR